MSNNVYNPLVKLIMVDGKLPSGWDTSMVADCMLMNLRAAESRVQVLPATWADVEAQSPIPADSPMVSTSADGADADGDDDVECVDACDAKLMSYLTDNVDVQKTSVESVDRTALYAFRSKSHSFFLAWLYWGPLGKDNQMLCVQPKPKPDVDRTRKGQREAAAGRAAGRSAQGTSLLDEQTLWSRHQLSTRPHATCERCGG